jgi:hypothetical protein
MYILFTYQDVGSYPHLQQTLPPFLPELNVIDSVWIRPQLTKVNSLLEVIRNYRSLGSFRNGRPLRSLRRPGGHEVLRVGQVREAQVLVRVRVVAVLGQVFVQQGQVEERALGGIAVDVPWGKYYQNNKRAINITVLIPEFCGRGAKSLSHLLWCATTLAAPPREPPTPLPQARTAQCRAPVRTRA